MREGGSMRWRTTPAVAVREAVAQEKAARKVMTVGTPALHRAGHRQAGPPAMSVGAAAS
jgi:hypothetical protein